MVDRRFGTAGERIVLEEFLAGHEASYFVLADGTRVVTLSSAQDHKRIFDDDQGPNTGGMGAFAPSPLITGDVDRRVLETIVRPVLDGMARDGRPYRGFLYVLAAAGYPDDPRDGDRITGLEEAASVPDALVFHAGTRRMGNDVATAGGRVLTVVGRGASDRDAIQVAYEAASKIAFEGMQYRRDIGRKAAGATG